MAISFAPCADAADYFCDKNKSEQSQQDSHQHTDICSPFCACNCCHLPMVNYNGSVSILPNNKISLDLEEEFSSHYPFFVSLYYQNIWQPPKI
ncbi:MAG: hypothetical protein M9958_09855 [Chitinophagales bacterium]|nr:hypothetical protein [Chitinophagales bacterium]